MKTALFSSTTADENTETPSSYFPAHDDATHQYLGADIFFRTLLDCGVDTLFGYPGGKVLRLYDHMLNYPDLKHVLVNHEQGAAHAADGYARVTGKPGVVLTTSGPGATNTVTGLANAYMDSIPMVVFSGQVETPLLGKMAFQESDIISITKAITKWNYQVQNVNQLEDAIKQAMQVATEGRPGPVLIDLPKDVFEESSVFRSAPVSISPQEHYMSKRNLEQLTLAASLISKAERPLIYAGGGIIASKTGHLLTQLAKENSIPVATTLMALGCFPEDHELSLGMLGMHGAWTANMAMQECDVLIALGARFDDRVTSKIEGFSPKSVKIHIDVDENVIGQNVPVEIGVCSQLEPALTTLVGQVKRPSTNRTPWLDQVERWKNSHPLEFDRDSKFLKPQAVIEKLSGITPDDTFVVTDVGQHQMWAAQFFEFRRPGSFVTSGGLGTMGFGLPAAIGVQLASPESSVVCISGDGGFRMTAGELSTAVEQRLPLKIFVFNNSSLGMVRQWQNMFYNERINSTILQQSNPDFLKLAESYGVPSFRMLKNQDVDSVLKSAFAINDRPVLVECIIDPEEDVFPMVSPGANLDEMVEWKDQMM